MNTQMTNQIDQPIQPLKIPCSITVDLNGKTMVANFHVSTAATIYIPPEDDVAQNKDDVK